MEITFDTDRGVIVVNVDGKEVEYATRDAYLLDYPNRAKDCDAMGWV